MRLTPSRIIYWAIAKLSGLKLFAVNSFRVQRACAVGKLDQTQCQQQISRNNSLRSAGMQQHPPPARWY